MRERPAHHAYATHAAIPSSRLEIFNGIGHYPNREDPEHFVRVLVDFMSSTQPAEVSTPRWRELLRQQHKADDDDGERPKNDRR